MKAPLVIVFFAVCGQISALPWITGIRDTIAKGPENLNLNQIQKTIGGQTNGLPNPLEMVSGALSNPAKALQDQASKVVDSLQNIQNIPTAVTEHTKELATKGGQTNGLPNPLEMVSGALNNPAKVLQDQASKVVDSLQNIQNIPTAVTEHTKLVENVLNVESVPELAKKGAEELEKVKDAVTENIPKLGFWSAIWNFIRPASDLVTETTAEWSKAIKENAGKVFSGSFLRGDKQ